MCEYLGGLHAHHALLNSILSEFGAPFYLESWCFLMAVSLLASLFLLPFSPRSLGPSLPTLPCRALSFLGLGIAGLGAFFIAPFLHSLVVLL